jgi:hypothetical protein
MRKYSSLTFLSLCSIFHAMNRWQGTRCVSAPVQPLDIHGHSPSYILTHDRVLVQVTTPGAGMTSMVMMNKLHCRRRQMHVVRHRENLPD